MEQDKERTHKISIYMAELFQHSGYVRQPNPVRQSTEGWGTYKKGWEVRLFVHKQAELETLQTMLNEAGF